MQHHYYGTPIIPYPLPRRTSTGLSFNRETKAAVDSRSFPRQGSLSNDTVWTWRTQLVPDVEAFPGHIACDGDSKSEIVIPILKNGSEEEVVAIIDIDCAVLNGFDETDQIWLEKLAVLLGGACDW
ncbi:uncharacterized protein RCO7_01159 [Rhynchosporium graminicola]|uniref:GAF domain-containing protein n=1 Tax=Rhynchosporium graminicola TaxID=2792576 RepID=A0A1E1JQP8_9HELO|nr:uncharacterized protein RCO7_01159 [Rhynchosporium commune]